MRWQGNYGWQAGHDYAEYELVATVSPASLTQQVCADLGGPEIGGASVRVDGGELVLISSGEDAIDSLQFVADKVFSHVQRLGGDVTWTERPPRDPQTGEAARLIDDNWIAAADLPTYAARRAHAVDLVAAALPEASVALRSDESAVIAVQLASREVLLGVGVPQLEMIEDAAAKGQLRDYVLD